MTRILCIFLTLMLASTAVYADKDQKKRDKIDKSASEMLERLYEEQPATKAEVASAVGYAAFSNVGVNVVFFSAGGGTGVVVNAKSGDRTYMNMGSAGVGLGLGVKDFRAIFVFHKQSALDNFINSGWDFSGQADAAAKTTDRGGEASAAGTVVNGVSIYQLTEAGLALQATLQGTKYWKSDSLN
jgi:lipid-binding SYLF domain-containing protein